MVQHGRQRRSHDLRAALRSHFCSVKNFCACFCSCFRLVDFLTSCCDVLTRLATECFKTSNKVSDLLRQSDITPLWPITPAVDHDASEKNLKHVGPCHCSGYLATVKMEERRFAADERHRAVMRNSQHLKNEPNIMFHFHWLNVRSEKVTKSTKRSGQRQLMLA